MTKNYDLVILGGGTGGYVAAIRASQLGMKVAIVEKDKIGGTCLHKGCIPSKALLRSAEVFRQTKDAEQFGVETGKANLNFTKVQKRKREIITHLHEGVQALMNKGKIDIYEGYGRILGPSIFSPMPGTISVEYENGNENTMIIPKNVIIATGSKPKMLENLEVDGQYVVTSDEALEMETLPNSITIIGGGVIGVEWASMLADFGVKVTIVEYLDHILPTVDRSIARELEKQLKKRGITFITGGKFVSHSIEEGKGVTIDVEVKEKIKKVTSDKVLVSVGREANRRDIGIENTSIVVEKDFIKVNKYYQTKESHIYAIGDVIGGMQLAHVASHEGIVAVDHMADRNPIPTAYDHIPTCVYSYPEAASVGLTEGQAEEQGFDIKIGKFPFQAIGKALVYGEIEGFVKIIVDKQSEDILGVHMIGPHVTDMISEAGLAKVLDATPWEMSLNVHPHPSLSEIIGEAAMAVDGHQIHI